MSAPIPHNCGETGCGYCDSLRGECCEHCTGWPGRYRASTGTATPLGDIADGGKS